MCRFSNLYRFCTAFFLVTLLVFTSGCSRTTQLSFLIQGDSRMNNGGHFAIVRIYQLGNDTKFLNAEFEPFWQDDEGILSGEIISGTKQQISLYPEEPVRHDLEIGKETRYIGFAANLYSPDGDRWRQLLPIEQLKKNEVRIWIRENQLVVDFL